MPPLRLPLNSAKLLSLHEQFTAYFHLVQTAAKQQMNMRYFSILYHRLDAHLYIACLQSATECVQTVDVECLLEVKKG